MNMNMNNPNMNFGASNRVGGGVVPVANRRRQMRTELTDEQKAEIREAFEIFDMDKDGALDFHEFKVHYFLIFPLLINQLFYYYC
jgi:hypothetical protein